MDVLLWNVPPQILVGDALWYAAQESGVGACLLRNVFDLPHEGVLGHGRCRNNLEGCDSTGRTWHLCRVGIPFSRTANEIF